MQGQYCMRGLIERKPLSVRRQVIALSEYKKALLGGNALHS